MGCLGAVGAGIVVVTVLGFHWMDGTTPTPNQVMFLLILGIVALVLDRLLPPERN